MIVIPDISIVALSVNNVVTSAKNAQELKKTVLNASKIVIEVLLPVAYAMILTLTQG